MGFWKVPKGRGKSVLGETKVPTYSDGGKGRSRKRGEGREWCTAGVRWGAGNVNGKGGGVVRDKIKKRSD